MSNDKRVYRLLKSKKFLLEKRKMEHFFVPSRTMEIKKYLISIHLISE